MNETPNFLIRLGEALGPVGSLVFLLLLSGGAVWVVMSIRRNQDDHARIESKVETLRKEIREESRETRAQIQALCNETQAESKETREEIQIVRRESHGDAQVTREMIRAINRRLDRIIDGTPPNQPG